MGPHRARPAQRVRALNLFQQDVYGSQRILKDCIVLRSPIYSCRQLHESLMYDRIEDIFAGRLHTFLADVQKVCRSIGEHIARTYFYYAAMA